MLQKATLTTIAKESIIKLYILLKETQQDYFGAFAADRFSVFFNPYRTSENKIEIAYCLLNAVLKKLPPPQELLASPILAEGNLGKIARLCFPELMPPQIAVELIYDWGLF